MIYILLQAAIFYSF